MFDGGQYRTVRRRFTVTFSCTIFLFIAGWVALSQCGEVQRIWIVTIGVPVLTVAFFTMKLTWSYLNGCMAPLRYDVSPPTCDWTISARLSRLRV